MQRLSSNLTGCLPSLRPILSFVLTGSAQPNPLRRKTCATGSSYAHWGSFKGTSSAGARGGTDAIFVHGDEDHLFTQLSEVESKAGKNGVNASMHQLQPVGRKPSGILVTNEINATWDNEQRV